MASPGDGGRPPEAEARSRTGESEEADLPESYTSNSPHEVVVLEQLKLFESQFRAIYGKKFLFLAPPNEWGCPKFISSYIKPAALPFPALCELEGAVRFVSDFWSPQPLSPPTCYPAELRGVGSVGAQRETLSFNRALFLASLLAAASYDVFVVAGTAPKAVAECDLTEEDCPYERYSEAPAAATENSKADSRQSGSNDGDADFKIELQETPRFVELQKLLDERERRRQEEEELQAAEQNPQPPLDRDPFRGRRIHCWVLVRAGPRGVSADLYVEPASGRIYEVANSPFEAVHFVWNQENLWVNMRPTLRASEMKFCLDNPRLFESALCPPPKVKPKDSALAPAELQKKKSHISSLLAPRAWSKAPVISAAAYRERYPFKQKVVYYKQAKVQHYCPYSQPDGLIRCVTFFRDRHRTDPEEIRMIFQHRKDGLEERVRFPISRKQIENYNSKNPHALRQVITIEGERRELHFYRTRLDGLVRHVEIFGKKVFEEFEGRDDLRCYHSITYTHKPHDSESENVQVAGVPVEVHRYSEKYTLPEDAEEGFWLHKVVCFSSGAMRIDFHPEPDSIIKPVLYFKKLRYLLQHDPETHPYSGATRAPAPCESELAMYRKLQKDLVTRFTAKNGALSQSAAVHHWRAEQEEAVAAARAAGDVPPHRRLRVVLHEDAESSTAAAAAAAAAAARVERGVGDHPAFPEPEAAAAAVAAAAAAAANASAAAAAAPPGAPEQKRAAAAGAAAAAAATAAAAAAAAASYPFCPHATLQPSFTDIASYCAYEIKPQTPRTPVAAPEDPKPAAIDLLAPYLIAFEGKEIDADRAEQIAKRAKNDLRVRMMGRAATIQQRLEEKQEQLKRTKELMQRRTREPPAEGEEPFDVQEALNHQNNLTFKIQILEQRLARHEMQALQKLNELECAILKHPRLKAMWAYSD